MPSLHIWKSIELARTKGAAAGSLSDMSLWDLPKRELLEAALHLAAVCTDSYDEAMTGDATGAVARLREELATLKENGII